MIKDSERTEQKSYVYERHMTGSLLFLSKIVAGISAKNKSLGFSLIKQRNNICKKFARVDFITKRNSIRSAFAEIKYTCKSLKSIERGFMKIYRNSSILNLYEAFNKLKMHKMSCEWSERITKTESNLMKTNLYIDELESSASPVKPAK